jgi:hypothetical protein
MFLVVFDVSRRGVISKIPKIGVKIVGSLTGGGGQTEHRLNENSPGIIRITIIRKLASVSSTR